MNVQVRRFLLFCALCALIVGSCFVFIRPSTTRAAGPTVQAWLTTSDGASQLTPQPNLTFGANTGNSSTITVNESQTFQQITGFGAAVTDSSAWLLYNKMSTSQRAAVMQKLFSLNQGIGLSFVRIPMGSSDFTINGPYSYDDLPSGQTDPNLNSFSINHDLAYILPILQQARSLNPNLTFMANPWSPPAWMKTNNSMLGTANGSTGTLNSADYGPLAQYFVKFIQAYGAQGIPISAVTPENEPEYAPSSYSGMSWSASSESAFIKNNLSPALNGAGLGSTKILGFDHNWGDTSFPSTLLNDPTTRADLGGIAWHCYGGSPTAMTTIYNSDPAVGQYETECATGAAVTPISTPDLLMQSTQNYAKTVELWNIALDPNHGPHTGGCPDCYGVVTIDQATGNVTYSNDYYQLGQYSEFVVPGAYHIGSNTLGSLADVAFKNPDGSKVVVAHNDGSSSSSFQVLWNNQGFNYTLPAGATVTFKWSDTTTPTVTPTSTTTPVATGNVQINAGGGAASSFVADTDFTGGATAGTANTISTSGVSNPAPQAVYQSNRYGNFSYAIPGLNAGASYTVRLHFAETYWTAAGQRTFNVSINGQQVLSSFDIVAAAGGANKAAVQQFTATADSSGKITIQFTSVKDNAQVNGIEILGGSSPTPTPTPTSTPVVGGTQINAGGSAVAPFVADTDFTGGATATTANTISTAGVTNPAPQGVYQSNRYGNFTYTIPGLAAGSSHTVRLHFAETYWTAVGQRTFNVSINGQQVLSSFDIIGAAGAANKATVQQFTTTADSSGKITIQFTTVKDNAQVNGIEII